MESTPNQAKTQRLAELTLLVASFIWGAAFVAQRSAMIHISPIFLNGVRFIIAGAILFIVHFATSRPELTKEAIFKGLKLGVILTLGMSLQQIGLVYTTAGKAGFITSLYVVLIPIVLIIFFRRRERPLIWLCTALAVLGLYLLSIDNQLHIEIGDLWIIACAFVFSFHVIFSSEYSKGVDPLLLSALQTSVCGVVSLIAAYILEQPTLAMVADAWLEVLYLIAFSSCLGFTMQLYSLRHVPPAEGAIILSLESVFALLCSWILLGERLTSRQLLGCAILFIAVIARPLLDLRKKQLPSADTLNDVSPLSSS